MTEQIYIPFNSKIQLKKKKIRKKIVNFFSKRMLGTFIYVKNADVFNKRIRLNQLTATCNKINKLAYILGLEKPFIADARVKEIDKKRVF